MIDRDALIFEAIERLTQKPKCMTCTHLDGPYLLEDVDEETAEFDVYDDFYGFCHAKAPNSEPIIGELENGDAEPLEYMWPKVICSEWCNEHNERIETMKTMPETPPATNDETQEE